MNPEPIVCEECGRHRRVSWVKVIRYVKVKGKSRRQAFADTCYLCDDCLRAADRAGQVLS